jgi:hypothetical protein
MRSRSSVLRTVSKSSLSLALTLTDGSRLPRRGTFEVPARFVGYALASSLGAAAVRNQWTYALTALTGRFGCTQRTLRAE